MGLNRGPSGATFSLTDTQKDTNMHILVPIFVQIGQAAEAWQQSKEIGLKHPLLFQRCPATTPNRVTYFLCERFHCKVIVSTS